MREFMSYVLQSFKDTTGWNRDNSYSELNETAEELLGFYTPRGLRLTLSSLATPHFATSYTIGSVGVVDGSISYLFSTVPLVDVIAQSERIPLPTLLRSYRELRELRPLSGSVISHGFGDGLPGGSPFNAVSEPAALGLGAREGGAQQTSGGLLREARKRWAEKPTLLYGRLYLPRSMLEAFVVRRIAPSVQLQLRAVSEAQLPNGGTVLGMIQWDKGRYGIEGIASSDGGLLGVRGLYNFGGDASVSTSIPPPAPATATTTSAAGSGAAPTENSTGERERIYGRFSAGGEIYYGTLNKSGGISLGARFATLPAHRGTPLTATLTINPLMGSLSATYALMAREYCSLATKFDFNVYSYESDWAVGMELWSKRRLAGLVDAAQIETEPPLPSGDAQKQEVPKLRERSFQAKLEWRLDEEQKPGPPPAEIMGDNKSAAPSSEEKQEDEYQGVLKARLDQNLRIGLLWEGRIKSLLFSLGSAIDLNKLDQPFRSLGLEIQFSS